MRRYVRRSGAGTASVRALVLASVLALVCSTGALAGHTAPVKPGATPAKNGVWEMKGTWTQDAGGFRFTDEKGREYEDEWLQNGFQWYYIGEDHYMKTGWFQDGERWYYFNDDGAMHRGWLTYDGALYYMSDQSGDMRTEGRLKKDDNREYVFAADGRASLAARSTGSNQVNSWESGEGGWRYIHPGWTYATGRWLEDDGKWYHFGTDGYMQTGWLQLRSGWYYLDSSGAMLRDTTANIDGAPYAFGPDGRLQ